jgi:hypothetical protein
MLSFPLPQLYSSLQAFIRQTLPDDCPTRLTNLVWMLSGLFLSGSVQLNLIARKLPLRAKKLSTVKRFSRFLDNPSVKTRAWYDPFARWILLSAASAGQVHLLIDSTKIAFDFRLILVSVAYRRRSLPLAWAWVKQTSGHSTTWMQVGVLQAVKAMLPTGVQVSLVGDCEFSRCPSLLSCVSGAGIMPYGKWIFRACGGKATGSGSASTACSLVPAAAGWAGSSLRTCTSNSPIWWSIGVKARNSPGIWQLTSVQCGRLCACIAVVCGLKPCLLI